jgi:hypothetical protein
MSNAPDETINLLRNAEENREQVDIVIEALQKEFPERVFSVAQQLDLKGRRAHMVLDITISPFIPEDHRASEGNYPIGTIPVPIGEDVKVNAIVLHCKDIVDQLSERER